MNNMNGRRSADYVVSLKEPTMVELEPRVEKLESMYQRTSDAIIRMEVDYEHLVRAVEKMQETMNIAVDLMAKQEANMSSIKSAHHRIDKLEDSITSCKMDKVHEVDFKELRKEVNSLKVEEAKSEWLGWLGGNIVKTVVTAVLVALLALVVSSQGVGK